MGGGRGKWRGDEANNDVIPSRERIRPSIFTRGQYNPGRWKIPSLTASVPGATHAASLKSGTICLIPRYTLRNFAYVGKNCGPGWPGGRHELWSKLTFSGPELLEHSAFTPRLKPDTVYKIVSHWLKHIVSDIILCIRAIYYVLCLSAWQLIES